MAEHIAVWGRDTNGMMDGPTIWIGTTTTSGGTWSVDYSAAGFIEAPIVHPTLILNSANVYDRGFASLSGTPSTTSASGYGIRGANLALLGPTTRIVPDGTVVQIMAVGETSATGG